MATYLAEHPEFLVAASETLHQRQQIAQQQAYVQLALQYRAELLSSSSPSVGPNEAKAAVVMFFDYQCSWCSKMAPVVENLIKVNPDTRFIFKEFPIFSSRWPVSGLAATQLAAVKEAQSSGAVHDALLTNQALAQHMDFSGTPAFVVMPQTQDGDVKRVTVIPGSTTQDMLQMAIQKAKG